jgi:hypothetical protein
MHGRTISDIKCSHSSHVVGMHAARLARLFFIVIALLVPLAVSGQTVAFPGAEGAARFASGGRGGRVIEVTNLNDNGPGSLRAAVQASGARTVVFRVSGTIKLLSKLEIKNGDITIAGQSAPGDGICVRDYTFRVSANNVIIRYMRFRLGDSTRYADDSFDGWSSTVNMHRRIILDHCSISWAIDENASFYDNAEFTLQWCYVTEGLEYSYHPKGAHGYGGIWGGWQASFHHNLFAHNAGRSPRFNGSRYTGQPDSEYVDFRNNVIYNWGSYSGDGGEAGHQNMVANYYKAGPGTRSGDVQRQIVKPYGPPDYTYGKWYIADNFIEGHPEATADNWTYGVQGIPQSIKDSIRVDQPFPSALITQQAAQDAYAQVLAFGGACLHRDTVDTRVTNEVLTGTATYGGLWGAHSGIIDSQDSVGGWPLLNSLPAPPDSDRDGMPDNWEIANVLDPYDSSDGRSIREDGYSNLEHYLNSLVPSSAPMGIKIRPERVKEFKLVSVYPNPFNATTTIEYEIPVRSVVKLEVFNVVGMSLTTLVEGELDAGVYRATFDGSNVSSGVYLVRLRAGQFSQIHKIILLR